MANLSQEQFKLLLETMTQTAIQAAAATVKKQGDETGKTAITRNDPSALGPMRQCVLGDDKMRKLTIFDDWLEEADSRMEYIGITNDKEKIILLRTWGGQDIKELIKRQSSIVNKSVTIKKEEESASEDTPSLEGETEPTDDYREMIESLRETLRRMVNRTMAMHQLMITKQGSMPWNSFIRELEIKAKILDLPNKPYTMDDAIKDAAIFGMNDGHMKERALAEDPTVETLTRWCQARESGREDAHNLKGPVQVKKLAAENMSDDDMEEEEIDDMIVSLQIMKLKKAGKYSARNNRLRPEHPTCLHCSALHEPTRCPAKGKECFSCGGKDHFSGSRLCPVPRRGTGETYSHSRMGNNETPARKVHFKDTPRYSASDSVAKRIVTIRKLSEDHHKWVEISINGIKRNLFTDTGSEFTILPPDIYDPRMGEIHKPDISLRAWGSTDNLKITGMVLPVLETKRGAKTSSKIYIVEGYQAEPLLGDRDAEELGFITFNKDGRGPTTDECRSVKACHPSIPQKLRDSLNVDVDTRPTITLSDSISAQSRKEITELVERYKGSVFDDRRIGLMKVEPIHLDYDPGYKPKQPTFRNVPVYYQDKLSDLLQFLRKQGVITDVDPRKSYDCVMNVVITDKTNGDIRMNVDNTPRNPGLKRTKFHVQTPQEIRHELKEAKIFTEMDMGWAYHQVPIDDETKETTIFQTHEGLHRMERLYFGPTASSGLFHSEVRKTLQGLSGVTNVHDNILVYSKDEATHKDQLEAALERCHESGITLKWSKSTFAKPMIKWFGRTFNCNGVTADIEKVNGIVEGGHPRDIEEIRSLLMACQYNAKFAFDNDNLGSYEEITRPLRMLLKKGATFYWDDELEEAYTKLIDVISDPSTLQAFCKDRETHIATDASESGIQASLYQVVASKQRQKPAWVPIDHVSRALTETESRYSPIERESLGMSWGMEQFRFYLVGNRFTAWTDHEPLPIIYNNRQKATSKRIARHRDRIQDLDFHAAYMRGCEMPCDYGSRHPNPIEHLSPEEQESLGFDNGKDVYVRKIISLDNSPNHVRMEQIEMAAKYDSQYQLMRELIQKGRPKPPPESPYKHVWSQLTAIDQLVYKGDNIVMPDASDQPGTTNIRIKMLDIAHEGHPGQSAMKRFLRAHIWFPRMDQMVTSVVQGCLQCQAATGTKHRDPLVPTRPPTQVWEHVDADHWGPTSDGIHLLVVIDETSKFPEVAVVRGTNAEDNIEAFDNIFAMHGFPSKLKTDGGPPFNGGENHLLQQYFKWAGIEHHTTHSADDPEANGLAEAFMKHVKKVWHTALMEKNNPQAELNKHLQMFRATPHVSTGYSPAHLLFGRKIRTRLPNPLREDNPVVTEAMLNDSKAKAVQKKYKDGKAYVKPHDIMINDHVLLRQQQTKSKPPYNPEPYKVIEINGHQITAEKEGSILTRDAQKWKTINLREKPDYARENKDNSQAMGTDEGELHNESAVGDPTRDDATGSKNSGSSAQPALEMTRSDCAGSSTGEVNTNNAGAALVESGSSSTMSAGTGRRQAETTRISERSNKGKMPTRYGHVD